VRVRFRTEAAADLESAKEWYGLKRDGLDEEFLAEVERVLDLVAERPGAFPLVRPLVHRSLVRRFPYAGDATPVQLRILGALTGWRVTATPRGDAMCFRSVD
jgi:plasmid stabilization system protein ParE